MKATEECPKCGSKDVTANAVAEDQTNYGPQAHKIAVYQKPDAIIFKEKSSSSLSAWVCTDCGYVEFYADNPSALKRLPHISPENPIPREF